jgi:hypothetical protein
VLTVRRVHSPAKVAGARKIETVVVAVAVASVVPLAIHWLSWGRGRDRGKGKGRGRGRPKRGRWHCRAAIVVNRHREQYFAPNSHTHIHSQFTHTNSERLKETDRLTGREAERETSKARRWMTIRHFLDDNTVLILSTVQYRQTYRLFYYYNMNRVPA